MTEGTLVPLITAVIVLLLIAALSAIGFKRLRFPYTIGLVFVGLILGLLSGHVPILQIFHKIRITPDVILYILLPTLVFYAAVNIDSRLLIKNFWPIFILAAPGLLIAMLITGGLVAWLTPLPIWPAMLFGGLISATDPVAVIALFKELGAPKRLTMLVDGESLFNDGTAMVAFQIITGFIASGVFTVFALVKGFFSFFVIFAGGAVVGAVIGYIMVRIIALTRDDPLIQVALSTVVAYAAFVVANYYLRLSGVMAAVGAGLVVNWYGSTRFTPEVKEYMFRFWEYAAFVANGFIFLLIGLTENFLIMDIIHSPVILVSIVVAIAGILIARSVVIFGLVPVINRLPGSDPIDRRNQLVMFWGGLRGALPIALAASIAMDFPHRAFILELTCGIVIFTLLVQGTTTQRLISYLKLDKEVFTDKVASLLSFIVARRKGVEALVSLGEGRHFPKELIDSKIKQYNEEVTGSKEALANLKDDPDFTETATPQILWSQVLTVERHGYRTMFENGFITESVLREFEYRNDLQKDKLLKGEIPPTHIITSTPVFFRIERRVVLFLDRFLCVSRFIRRRKTSVIGYSYERNMALAGISRRVIESLDHLAELCNASSDTVEECRRYYEHQRKTALNRFDAVSREFSKMISGVMEQTLDRVASNVELKIIQELVSNGAMSEKVAQQMEDEIKNKLDRAKSRNSA